MHPRMRDVNSQKTHVDVVARVATSENMRGQNTKTTGVNGSDFQNVKVRVSRVGMDSSSISEIIWKMEDNIGTSGTYTMMQF